MITSGADVCGLKQQRPEWQPWLAVVEEVLREAASSRWDAVVPNGDSRNGGPRLAGIEIVLRAASVGRLVGRLVRVASAAGTPKMATLARTLGPDLDFLTLFTASLCHDVDAVAAIAAQTGADAEALQAVAALVAVPFLQACNRQWASSLPESWIEGYCPVCGAWPAFAEVRGIERSRYLRCGRCGGQWHAHSLFCPYCAMRDHEQLVSLVPERTGARAAIDACRGCSGYVKTFTTLQGCAADAVLLEDLATVDLDLAALEEGYVRPAGPGRDLGVTVTEGGGRRGLFAWRP